MGRTAPRHRASRSGAATAPPLLLAGVALGLVVGISAAMAVAPASSPPAGDVVAQAVAATRAPTTAGTATDAPSPAVAPHGPPLTLAFAGDVMFSGAVAPRLASDGDALLAPVAEVLGGVDLAVVNLETAITDRGEAAPKQFSFRGPPAGLDALVAAGVDVASLANNHGMDYGRTGLADTLAAAGASGLPIVGAGPDAGAAYAPFVTEVRGRTVAVLGATQVLDAAFLDTWTAADDRPGLASAKDPHVDRLVAAVAAARVVADTVVVVLHWGIERHTCPSVAQQTLARRLVDAGADVVVGGHAHRLQGAGTLNGAVVAYGLGNFLFSTPPGPGADSGVLRVAIDGRDAIGAQWIPVRLEGGVPHPLDGELAAVAAARFEALRGCTGLAPLPGGG